MSKAVYPFPTETQTITSGQKSETFVLGEVDTEGFESGVMIMTISAFHAPSGATGPHPNINATFTIAAMDPVTGTVVDSVSIDGGSMSLGATDQTVLPKADLEGNPFNFAATKYQLSLNLSNSDTTATGGGLDVSLAVILQD